MSYTSLIFRRSPWSDPNSLYFYNRDVSQNGHSIFGLPRHEGLNDLLALWPEVLNAFVGPSLVLLEVRVFDDGHHVALGYILETRTRLIARSQSADVPRAGRGRDCTPAQRRPERPVNRLDFLSIKPFLLSAPMSSDGITPRISGDALRVPVRRCNAYPCSRSGVCASSTTLIALIVELRVLRSRIEYTNRNGHSRLTWLSRNKAA